MTFKPYLILAALGLTVTAVFAHENVTNQTVMIRMHTMESIGKATRTLAEMSKGTMDFDEARISQELNALSEAGARIHLEFRPNETDPESRALPTIWEDFNDFKSKADAMTNLVAGFDSIKSQDDLSAIIPEIGQACSVCHKLYRRPE